MLRKKIIVRKFGKFKGLKGEYIRVSSGTYSQNKKFIKALESL